MKYFAFFSFLLIFAFSCSEDTHAQAEDNLFKIYLVRHSEKNIGSGHNSNPSLTPCGVRRSEYLKNFLKDVNLDVIYSTDYIRTLSTARPTANSKGLEIEKYNAEELKAFSKLLLNKKNNALVIGHSNTTGVLAGLLVEKKIGAFDSSIYDRIYKVVVYKNKARLQLLHMTMDCKD